MPKPSWVDSTDEFNNRMRDLELKNLKKKIEMLENRKGAKLYNLEDWFLDWIDKQNEQPPLAGFDKDGNLEILFYGFELILKPDGTYILNDTTG